jgi:hypothetical protein
MLAATVVLAVLCQAEASSTTTEAASTTTQDAGVLVEKCELIVKVRDESVGYQVLGALAAKAFPFDLKVGNVSVELNFVELTAGKDDLLGLIKEEEMTFLSPESEEEQADVQSDDTATTTASAASTTSSAASRRSAAVPATIGETSPALRGLAEIPTHTIRVGVVVEFDSKAFFRRARFAFRYPTLQKMLDEQKMDVSVIEFKVKWCSISRCYPWPGMLYVEDTTPPVDVSSGKMVASVAIAVVATLATFVICAVAACVALGLLRRRQLESQSSSSRAKSIVFAEEPEQMEAWKQEALKNLHKYDDLQMSAHAADVLGRAHSKEGKPAAYADQKEEEVSDLQQNDTNMNEPIVCLSDRHVALPGDIKSYVDHMLDNEGSPVHENKLARVASPRLGSDDVDADVEAEIEEEIEEDFCPPPIEEEIEENFTTDENPLMELGYGQGLPVNFGFDMDDGQAAVIPSMGGSYAQTPIFFGKDTEELLDDGTSPWIPPMESSRVHGGFQPTGAVQFRGFGPMAPTAPSTFGPIVVPIETPRIQSTPVLSDCFELGARPPMLDETEFECPSPNFGEPAVQVCQQTAQI